MEVCLPNLLVIAGVLILPWIWKVFNYVWWRPKRLEMALKKQGIHGPPFKLLSGNIIDISKALKEARSKPMDLSHQILPRVAPFQLQTVKNYGDPHDAASRFHGTDIYKVACWQERWCGSTAASCGALPLYDQLFEARVDMATADADV